VVRAAQAGEIIVIDDGVHLEILNPSNQLPAISDQHDNDLSVALQLTYNDFSLLLTGDDTQSIEKELSAVSGLASEPHAPLSVDVYKDGHGFVVHQDAE